MRITDRYQNLMDRSPATGARGAEKAAQARQAENAKTTREAQSAAKADQSSPLKVNVSSRAQELAAGAARVEELKASIKNGTFKVDADKIAGKLVGDE